MILKLTQLTTKRPVAFHVENITHIEPCGDGVGQSLIWAAGQKHPVEVAGDYVDVIREWERLLARAIARSEG